MLALPGGENRIARIINWIINNPDRAQEIFNQAWQAGQDLANWGREQVNNILNQGGQIEDIEHEIDYADRESRRKEPVTQMEADSTTDTPQSLTSGSIGSNGGPRGKFVGNTQTTTGYEKYYHERQYGHSKKLKELMFTWGVSKYGPRNFLSGNAFPLYKWGTTGSGGKATPGIVAIKSTDIYGNATINPFTPYGENQQYVDFSENIYSNPLNFYLGDFLDNKLFNDSGTKGFFLNYNKFRLLSFTIELTPYGVAESLLHYAPNVFNSSRGTNGWEVLLTPEEKTIFQAYRTLPFDQEKTLPGYFIHRDVYNTYGGTTGIIPVVPESSLATSDDTKFKREQFAIKNLDHNLTFVKNGEKFSFTREIKPQGNYYMDRAGILNNLKTPISTIVNILEGQLDAGQSLVKKNPEGFNLLIVPGNCKVEMFGEINLGGAGPSQGNGYLLIPVLNTTICLKTTAKWEAFDYNYTDNQNNFADPLEKALLDYSVEKTYTQAHLNRGVN